MLNNLFSLCTIFGCSVILLVLCYVVELIKKVNEF